MIDYYKELHRKKGISLKDLGVEESGLYRDDALRAIEQFRISSVPILGGDVYFELEGGLQPAYANWHVDRSETESLGDFVARSCLHAEKYILSFPRPPGKRPLFVLVPASN